MKERNTDLEKMLVHNQSASQSNFTEDLTYPGFTGPGSGILDCQDSSKGEGASLRKMGLSFCSHFRCHLIFMAACTWRF